MDINRYWDVKRVAEHLGLCPGTIYNLVKSGQLPGAIRLRKTMIPTEAIDAFLRSRTYQPAAK